MRIRLFFPLMIAMALVGQTLHAEALNVWLAAGQSNMVGAGRVEDLPDDFDFTIDEVLYSQDVEIVAPEGLGPLQPRLTMTQGIRRWYGSELTFGSSLANRPGGNNAILKFARNGSPLGTKWHQEGEDLLGFYDFVDDHLEQLGNLGFEPRVVGMLWVQGTGDAFSQTLAGRYADNLTTMVSGIRDRYESPQMQFLFSQAHANMARNFVETVRQQQQEYAAGDPNSVLVNIDDLALSSDSVHYTSATQQALGFRFAAVAVPEPHLSSLIFFLISVGFLLFRSKKQHCRPLA